MPLMPLAIGKSLILQKEGDKMGLGLSKLAKAIFFSFFVLMPFSSWAQSETPRLNVDQLVDEALVAGTMQRGNSARL
jgi:hypothetical protein